MKLLNRSALMLQPLQPYLDWVNDLPPGVSELDQPLAVGALDDEGRVYLVDEFDSDRTVESVLERQWPALLENELGAWDELGLHWPDPLRAELLSQWFDIKPLTLAFDASAETLMTAEL